MKCAVCPSHTYKKRDRHAYDLQPFLPSSLPLQQQQKKKKAKTQKRTRNQDDETKRQMGRECDGDELDADHVHDERMMMTREDDDERKKKMGAETGDEQE